MQNLGQSLATPYASSVARTKSSMWVVAKSVRLRTKPQRACPGVIASRAHGVDNPITGRHIELVCEMKPGAAHSSRQIKPLSERTTPAQVSTAHRANPADPTQPLVQQPVTRARQRHQCWTRSATVSRGYRICGTRRIFHRFSQNPFVAIAQKVKLTWGRLQVWGVNDECLLANPKSAARISPTLCKFRMRQWRASPAMNWSH